MNQLHTLQALAGLYRPMCLEDALRWAYFIDSVITRREFDTLSGHAGESRPWWLRDLAYMEA